MTYLPMLKAQHSLNVLATKDEDYLARELPFYRKAWEEAAECLVHLGDYWWKAQTVDVGQVRLELVDIWHFILSVGLNEYPTDFAKAAEVIGEAVVVPAGQTPPDYNIELLDQNGFRYMFVHGLEGFITDLISFDRVSKGNAELRKDAFWQIYRTFVYLVRGVGWTMADIERAYTIKFTLNIFRQYNGYREGTYQKMWEPGVEDNVFVTEIYDNMPIGDTVAWVDIVDGLYARIHDKYNHYVDKPVADDKTRVAEREEQRAKVRKMLGA